MAIAFNLPSEREPTEESYSRLNRLLAELYDVLCHILVSRQPPPATPAPAAPAATPQQPSRDQRERPFSESDAERGGPPGAGARPPPRPRSARAAPPPLDLGHLDDDVFVSPRTDNGNDPFSSRHNVEIFGSPRSASPRTPAGLLLSPRGRRERRFAFSATSERHWRDKGGTPALDETDGGEAGRTGSDSDQVDSDAAHSKITSASSEGSLLSCILPDKLSGSICTAVLFVLGWRLLAHKR